MQGPSPAPSRAPNHVDAAAMVRAYRGLGLSHIHWQVSDTDAASGQGKGPRETGWNVKAYGDPGPSPSPWQVGLLTGVEIAGDPGRSPCAGRWLVCVDVDDPAAQAAVDAALPATGLRGGKASTPRSHLFYAVEGKANSFRWLGKRSDGRDGCVLELRGCAGNGLPLQVLAAPSLHYASGDAVVWDSLGEPACVGAADIYNACLRALATAYGGNVRLEGKGKPKPLLFAAKAPPASARVAAAKVSDADAGGHRVSDDAGRDVTLARAVDAVRRAGKGSVQETLNRWAFSAASELAGSGACDAWFDRLEDALVHAYDDAGRVEQGHDFRKWQATVRRAVAQGRERPRRRRGVAAFRLTDQGSADLLAEAWRDRFRFFAGGAAAAGESRGEWRQWDGVKWTATRADQLVRETAEEFRAAAADAARCGDKAFEEAAVPYYFSAESRNKGTAAVALLRASLGQGGLAVPRQDADRDPWLFNCGNGVFDIRSGRLLPHDRDFVMTRASPYSYVPGARSPALDAALAFAFGEQPDSGACVRYLMRWLGYYATGDVSQQKLLVLYGSGCNGKSELLGALGRALDAYATPLQRSVLVQGGDSKATDEVAELQGVRMAWYSELSPTDFLNEGRVKQLTGNTRLKARFLYEGSFEFDATAKFCVDTNYMPRIRGTDLGILRRVKPLPYSRYIPDGMRVPDWGRRTLEAEGDGFLSSVLDEAHAYYVSGLMPEPECVRAACAAFAEDNDHIGCFLSELCDVSDRPDVPGDLRCGADDLYQRYRTWAAQGGYTPFNVKNFGARVADKGYVQLRTKLGRVWTGIAIKPILAADAVMKGGG